MKETNKICISTVTSGWILQKISHRLVEADPTDILFVGKEVSHKALANLYIDVINCYHVPSKILDVGLWTHVHENDMKWVHQRARSLDYIIHMCPRYYEMFATDGYRKDRMSVVLLGAPGQQFKLKKPIIGIIQRGLDVGKGNDFLPRFLKDYHYTASKFAWAFAGKGWEALMEDLKTWGFEVFATDETDYSNYPELFRSMDYLLIPSLWEGGPQALLEALACGVPVISSDVGFVKEVGVDFLYEPGNGAVLNGILDTIICRYEQRRQRVDKELFTYEYQAAEVIRIVKEAAVNVGHSSSGMWTRPS